MADWACARTASRSPGRGCSPTAAGRSTRPGVDFYSRLVDALLASGHRALGHALPLGPAPGAAGPRRLARARHGGALRRVRRRGRTSGCGDRVDVVDDAQRAVGVGVPRLRHGRHAPGLQDPGGAARRAPPDAGPRPGGRGDARPGRRREQVGIALNVSPTRPGQRRPGRRRRRPPHRRAHEPDLLRPGAARPLPRRRARGHRARDRLAVHRRPATWSAIGVPLDFVGINYYYRTVVRAGAASRDTTSVCGRPATSSRRARPAADRDGLGGRPGRPVRPADAGGATTSPACRSTSPRTAPPSDEQGRGRRGPRPRPRRLPDGTSARRTARSPTASTCAATSCGRCSTTSSGRSATRSASA